MIVIHRELLELFFVAGSQIDIFLYIACNVTVLALQCSRFGLLLILKYFS